MGKPVHNLREHVERMDGQQSQREQFRDIVLAAMNARSWSAERTAHEAGLTAGTMTRVTNARTVRPDTVEKLRRALGIESLTVAQSEEGFDVVIDVVCGALAMVLRELPREDLTPVVANVMKALATRDE